jgi:hypothetical protein
MNKLTRWLAIPTTLAIALGTTTAALSQMVAITPNSPTIELTGMSGGGNKDKSCAGYIAATPNHTIQITEDSSLQFTLQASGGQPALLIRSASGQDFCVPADSYSGGKVQIPGRWSKGNYSVFVGDRANGQHSYTLTISRR